MASEQGDLASTQHWLWRLLSEPDGVLHALREAGDGQGEALRARVREDRGIPALTRAGVYANAYFSRLRDVLARDYGALAQSLGEAAFHDLAKLYLFACPPSHFSLREAGAALPLFLRDHGAAELFRSRWPFAADLATLEWALTLAFDAADAPVLERAALAGVPAGSWVGLRLRTTPALQTLRLSFAVHVLRRRFDAGEAVLPPAAAREPTLVRVWRKDERVFHCRMSALEAEALELVRRGEPFGALCDCVERSVGAEQTPARATALLESWIDDGILSEIA